MNFADNFTAADARAQVLHNKNASLFPQAVECINDAVEAELRSCGLEVGDDFAEAELLADVLEDRGFNAAVVDHLNVGADSRYHLNISW